MTAIFSLYTFTLLLNTLQLQAEHKVANYLNSRYLTIRYTYFTGNNNYTCLLRLFPKHYYPFLSCQTNLKSIFRLLPRQPITKLQNITSLFIWHQKPR